jgi:hypothetical protein
MDRLEKIARAMAQTDGVEPDQPLEGYVPIAKLFMAASAVLADR